MKLQEENLRRRNELAIYHFVVDAELRLVHVRKSATNLLECQLEPISKGVSTHVHKFDVVGFELLFEVSKAFFSMVREAMEEAL